MVQSGTIMDWDELHNQGANISGAGGVTVYVWYPFIVNTAAIRKDEEVVLQSAKYEVKDFRKRKALTAFDQLERRNRKKQAHGKTA